MEKIRVKKIMVTQRPIIIIFCHRNFLSDCRVRVGVRVRIRVRVGIRISC